MKAIILAAGRGSRMGPLTENFPKCLTKINGTALIDYQIAALQGAGVHDIALVTGYKADCLKKYGTHHFHNEKWEETNMVYSLFCAQEWLTEFPCIISYSDIYYEVQVIQALMAAEGEAVIAYDPHWLDLWSKRFIDPLDDAETFRMDVQGQLVEIGNKPTSVTEIQGQYMGLLKFLPEFWKNISLVNNNKMDMTSYLNKMIKIGKKINTVENRTKWFEIDNESDLSVFYALEKNHS